MGKSHPVRGNVLKLSCPEENPSNPESPTNRFYKIMWKEGSAVSQAYCSSETHRLNDVYYWKGAVVTFGSTSDGIVLVLQKNGQMKDLDELVKDLEDKMQVKLNREIISAEE